jgi:hypothetical protein
MTMLLSELNVMTASERGMPTRTAYDAEFLNYHYKYGHILLLHIQDMAKQGILPKYLARCNLPIWLAFI